MHRMLAAERIPQILDCIFLSIYENLSKKRTCLSPPLLLQQESHLSKDATCSCKEATHNIHPSSTRSQGGPLQGPTLPSLSSEESCSTHTGNTMHTPPLILPNAPDRKSDTEWQENDVDLAPIIGNSTDRDRHRQIPLESGEEDITALKEGRSLQKVGEG